MPRYSAFDELSKDEQAVAAHRFNHAHCGDGYTYQVEPQQGPVARSRERHPPVLDALPDEALGLTR
jgi:hypothetical protein